MSRFNRTPSPAYRRTVSALNDLAGEYARDILDFADENGFTVAFDAGLSWHFPGQTVLVAVVVE